MNENWFLTNGPQSLATFHDNTSNMAHAYFSQYCLYFLLTSSNFPSVFKKYMLEGHQLKIMNDLLIFQIHIRKTHSKVIYRLKSFEVVSEWSQRTYIANNTHIHTQMCYSRNVTCNIVKFLKIAVSGRFQMAL